MLDLRQQALSLAAVFVALALGVAVGAAAAGSRLLWGQEQLVRRLEQDFTALQEQLRRSSQERQRLMSDLAFYRGSLDALVPHLVSGKLAGRNVTVEVSPGADGAARDVVSVLDASGAVVSTTRSGASATSGAMPPHLVVRTACASVVGFVGPPEDVARAAAGDLALLAAGSGGRGEDEVAPASPVAWTWQVDEPVGRLALVEALSRSHRGPLVPPDAIRLLVAPRAPGRESDDDRSAERSGACL